MGEPHEHLVFVVALAVTAVAGFYDWRYGIIPNWLTYAALLCAPFIHVGRILAVHEPADWALTEGGFSLLGAVVCAAVPLMLQRRGAMGWGDVKLLAAVGALLQSRNGVAAEMVGFFAATLIAPAQLAYQGKLFVTLKNAATLGANMFRPASKQQAVDQAAMSSFRLGPAIFFGVALVAYMNW